ncbi:MAG TPA: hypothetical protein VMO26_14150 [Vicinamibacterales bacterium]|nr:hypothetical protein [Vicinamibacterales bacterium]
MQRARRNVMLGAAVAVAAVAASAAVMAQATQPTNDAPNPYSFGRPSGVAVDRNGMLYVADSESGSVSRDPNDRTKVVRTEWTRGIRAGSLKDGKITAFIPDPQKDLRSGTLAAEGVAIDAAGNVYGAEVGPRKLTKYVPRK